MWERRFRISGVSMKTENVVRDKSYALAVRVVKLAQVQSLLADTEELQKIIGSILKTLREKASPP